MAGDSRTFVELRLAGGRFTRAGMPVEALTELVAYRELIIDVAKEVFRRRHPLRQRVPKGFVDRLELRLTTVQSGSVVPVLERVAESMLFASLPDEFSEARDLVNDAVAAAGDAGPWPDIVRDATLSSFQRLGRNLRHDERLELVVPGRPVVQYDQKVRRTIVLRGQDRYLDEAELVGHVVEVDRDAARFRLRIDDQLAVTVPYELEAFSVVHDALVPTGPRVRVEGVVEYDRRSMPLQVEQGAEVSQVDEQLETAYGEVEQRLIELGELDDGWYNGEGRAPTEVALDRTRQAISSLRRISLPNPRLFPTVDGGVQAEWNLDAIEASVAFESNGAGHLSALDVDTGKDYQVDLDEIESRAVVGFLERLMDKGVP